MRWRLWGRGGLSLGRDGGVWTVPGVVGRELGDTLCMSDTVNIILTSVKHISSTTHFDYQLEFFYFFKSA